MQYTMGGRMDDHPLSLKDSCLVEHLQELDQAGVACVKIEGRGSVRSIRAIVTGIYSRAIRRKPTAYPGRDGDAGDGLLRQGFTQGYFTGNKEDMFWCAPGGAGQGR